MSRSPRAISIDPLTERCAALVAGGARRVRRMRQMNVRRALTVLVMAFLVLGIAVRAASGSPPTRSCPPSFDGPLTFEQIVAKYPPPPHIPDPISLLAGFDNNGDGSLCVLDLPGDPINTIDNVANVP
jgi:hypothetical protein